MSLHITQKRVSKRGDAQTTVLLYLDSMATNHHVIPKNYQAYLIRCTWVSNRQMWLTTLKEIESGREHHFPDAGQALAFLQQQLDANRPTEPIEPFDSVSDPRQIL